MKTSKKPPARTLQIRKRRDGRITLEAPAPDVHAFSARWIDRYLGDLVDVNIVIHTTDGDLTYRLAGFDPLLDAAGNQLVELSVGGEEVPKKNWTALVAQRIEE